MPTALTECLSIEMAASEPWSPDAVLYTPYTTEQILLADSAQCVAVQAFLKMCSLEYTVEQRANAENMSPSGRVPLLRCGKFVISEFDPIVAFVTKKGIMLNNLDSKHQADMQAFISLVHNVLGNAELYISWLDAETFETVTAPRYGSFQPWPLGGVLTWLRRRKMAARLQALQWADKTLDAVYAEVDTCCRALSERLGKEPYFFGSQPTPLDALVYGHLYTIITTPLQDTRLASIVNGYSNLVRLTNHVDAEYFKGIEIIG
ncbi:metaxin-2-like [Pollicipes pollicipes]|uniref:metaxin-2-like n=1 Tax=Pollicipes pollicipes TaxID=41117 RepID=UPI00188508A0|nr:metaxin-2-like [Pollicipes pollicipes]XP_037075470.1 metaxin-2-like [Pollicipes pollicipes]